MVNYWIISATLLGRSLLFLLHDQHWKPCDFPFINSKAASFYRVIVLVLCPTLFNILHWIAYARFIGKIVVFSSSLLCLLSWQYWMLVFCPEFIGLRERSTQCTVICFSCYFFPVLIAMTEDKIFIHHRMLHSVDSVRCFNDNYMHLVNISCWNILTLK